MAERDTDSDLPDEPRRRISITTWISAIVVSFALGAFVTHFALLQDEIAQFSLQGFLTSTFWSTASIALVCFILGIGFAYVPFMWYRQDADRFLRTEYRALREKAESSRTSRDVRKPPPVELEEPLFAERDGGSQDIAAALSEMSEAIRANLRETGPAQAARGDMRQPLRPTASDE